MREKEKGDWKNLTIDEKKRLYRASFRLTFAELDAPTGRFKSHFGWACVWWATGIWLFMAFYYASKNTLYFVLRKLYLLIIINIFTPCFRKSRYASSFTFIGKSTGPVTKNYCTKDESNYWYRIQVGL